MAEPNIPQTKRTLSGTIKRQAKSLQVDVAKLHDIFEQECKPDPTLHPLISASRILLETSEDFPNLESLVPKRRGRWVKG